MKRLVVAALAGATPASATLSVDGTPVATTALPAVARR
jgi:hypothetical protein